MKRNPRQSTFTPLLGRHLVEAQRRLDEEHSTLHALILSSVVQGLDDRQGALEHGDMADSEESLTTQGEDDAVDEVLRERLAGVHAARERLAQGTYGFSSRSGDPIDEERLRADPAANLTAQEAAEV